MKRNILVLSAGTQGLITAKCLYQCGFRVVLITSGKYNYADVSRYVDKLIRYDETSSDYLAFVQEVMAQQHIDVVIPMGDADAEFLCRNADKFPAGVKFKLPAYENFQRGYDKNRLMGLCKKRNYPHPQTSDLSLASLDSEEVREFPYPAMLKPNCTSGCRGMVEVKSYEELLEKYPELHKQYGDYHLQRFVLPGGRQVKIQLYVDESGNLLAHSALQKLRWYPNKGGSNTCCVSVNEDRMVKVCHQILKDLHWVGFADFDLIEDPDTNKLLVMEINPRLPACIKGAVVAGINWPEVIVNDSLGLPQKEYVYRTGVYLRHLGLDFLWFLRAKNRWSAKPCWLKFVAPKLYYQDASSLTDPMPFVMGTWHNIVKLFNPKKAKQGR